MCFLLFLSLAINVVGSGGTHTCNKMQYINNYFFANKNLFFLCRSENGILTWYEVASPQKVIL